ncbi:MAG: hypothetical protein ACO39C_05635 [Chthoniobacterales bacterium]
MKKMVRGALAAVFFAAAGAGAQTVAPELLKPENRTVSSSKQFTIFGGTRQERSELARRADQLKEGLQKELGLGVEWRDPILIVLTPGDAVRLRQPRVFVQVFDAEEAGRKIEVDLSPGALQDRALVEGGIIRALLLEISLRKQKFEGNRFVEPPSWLVAAMTAALARGDEVFGAAVYSGLLEGKGMPKLARFLKENGENLRGRTREIHAAQSYAFYRALSESDGGRARVAENLTLAEPSRDPVDRFGQTWPDLLEDPDRMARMWALSVARLASPERTDFVSAPDSSAKLAAVIESLAVPESELDPPGAMLELARTPEGRFRFEQAATELRRLGFRAHPLYAALVEEYREMFDDMARKRRRGFVAKFNEAEDLRWALDERSNEITDYLNWYQANAPSTEPMVDLATILPPESTTRRNDAISRYLDSVEQRGW